MDRFDSLQVFVRVAEAGSFTRAADSLHLPRSSVSTAIRQLEARVGVRLLHRTTRRVSLTRDGEAYYERCLRLLADLEETETLFRHESAPRGRLRIDVPGRIGRLIVAPALPDFFARYPAIELEMGVTDRPVDLVREGVDCALRVGVLGDSSLIARQIGSLRMINCASPAYLARHGTPSDGRDLERHLAVNYASPGNGKVDSWDYLRDGQRQALALRAQVTVNNAEAYIACCLAGLGLIQIPAYDVRDHLAAGELVEVLPDCRAESLPMALLYPHRRHLSRRLQVFADWLVPLLRDRLLLDERPAD